VYIVVPYPQEFDDKDALERDGIDPPPECELSGGGLLKKSAIFGANIPPAPSEKMHFSSHEIFSEVRIHVP
jgi:hypothetical protein